MSNKARLRRARERIVSVLGVGFGCCWCCCCLRSLGWDRYCGVGWVMVSVPSWSGETAIVK